MNAFFAAVEQAANPALRGKPIAVGGGIQKASIVAAASYEAKKRGIKTAMGTWEAKKICPELIIVVGDMAKYISTSKEITKYLTRYSDLVEVFSIDEAFVDVTATEERFGGALEIAKEIKGWIRSRFNLTCNIGIGPNKLMAKLAGELKKPDGLIILREEDIPEKIKDVPVSELCGVGRKMEIYLGELGIRTIGQLNKYPRGLLVKRFGMAYGEHLWQMGQGKDNSPVLPYWHEEDAKSMGHSFTLPKATADINEVKSYLLRLSEQLGRRLRHNGYKGNVVHLSVGFGNFEFWGKQKKACDHMNDGYEIFKFAEKIFDEHSFFFNKPFRFVGIYLSNLAHNIDQVSIFEEKEKKKQVLKAMDKINDRFGEFTVERAGIMNTVLQKKTGMVTSRMYKFNDQV